jgi:hypothetical protein
LDHGGDVVQTFNTVDIYSNDAYSTSHATKTAATACEHLLQTWQQFGGPTGPSLITKARSAAPTIPQVLGVPRGVIRVVKEHRVLRGP